MRPRAVESEPVNQRAIFRKAKETRLWISLLRLRRDRADLRETETERTPFIYRKTVLIETGGKPNRILQLPAEGAAMQAAILNDLRLDKP